MTEASLEPLVGPLSSPGKRLLIGLLGVVVLVVSAIVTVGFAMASMAAIVLALFVMRKRRKLLTRLHVWLVGVGGALLPLMVFVGYAAVSMPEQSPEATRQSIAEARAQRDAGILKKIMPNQPAANPAADSLTDRLLGNPSLMKWLGVFGLMIGSGFVGTLAGTFAWATTMLLYHAIRGRAFESGPGPSPSESAA